MIGINADEKKTWGIGSFQAFFDVNIDVKMQFSLVLIRQNETSENRCNH